MIEAPSRPRRRGLLLLALILTTAAALLSALPAAANTAAPVAAAAAAVPSSTGQVVSVQAQPGSSYGTLVAWQRQASGAWSVAQGPVQVRLGSRGLGPAREGSSYTPEGTFPLTEAFGRLANPGTRMPYFTTDRLDWWDGEVSSPTYNRHIRSATSPGGASENLYGAGAVYDLAVNIGYNLNPTVPGGGSAFFVHVTDGNATAGCVALPRADMTRLITWLDPAQNPQITLTTGAAWTPPVNDRVPTEGQFFRVEGDSKIYRTVGGAPVYVNNWAPFAGSQISTVVPTVLGRMRQQPADGTFVMTAEDGRIFRYAGGAAIYVDSWAPFGAQPTTVINAGAVDAAGWGPWTNLRTTPADGTFVMTAGDGRIYRYAGGAAVYVDSWAPFGAQPTTLISARAVSAAGTGSWSALRTTPADGTFVMTAGDGRIYRYAGGAAVYVDSWAPFGAQPTTLISAGAVAAAGWGPWSTLRTTPADGTFLLAAGEGHVHVMVGGSPIWVDSWSAYGGPQPMVAVSASALSAPGRGLWTNLRPAPADASLAHFADGRVYTFTGGRLVYVPSWAPWGGPRATALLPTGLLAGAGTNRWASIGKP